MQIRHIDRERYFDELAITSRKHYIPFIKNYHKLSSGLRVLEIGCGDGGNLLPFARMGCNVVGIDISITRIKDAKCFFAEKHTTGKFIATDIFNRPDLGNLFDIVICHDVYEHIENKVGLLEIIERYMAPTGIAFIAFPAWQMPFGGHQQICHNRIISKIPFIHLLPSDIYRFLLILFREKPNCVTELLSIKRTGTTVEQFEKHIKSSKLSICHRELWFINPHYEIKFGLKVRKLNVMIASIPYFRNLFCSSCGYILRKKDMIEYSQKRNLKG